MALLTMTLSFVFWRNVFGARFTKGGGVSRHNSDSAGERMIPRRIQWTVAAFAAVVLFLIIRRAISISGSVNILMSMQLLRTRLNYEGASWGAVAYLATAVSVFAVYMSTLTKGQGFVERAPATLVTVIAFAIAVVTTQRTAILMLLVALTFARSKEGIPSLRAIGVAGVLFLTFFLVAGFSVGKIGRQGSSIGEILSLGWIAALQYLLTPLSAFSISEVWINPPADGAITLRFFLKALQYFDLYTGHTSDLVQEYVFVPIPTNVYTFAHMAILDFGSAYFCYFLVIGVIIGLIFSFPRRGPFGRSLQGFSYYAIIMTVFQDQFFSIASQWLQIFLALFICYAVTRNRSRPRGVTTLPRSSAPGVNDDTATEQHC